MSLSLVSRPAALLAALSMIATWTARAETPDSCKFLAPAAVSAALGKPVTGGTVSMVDHAGATTSSCSYRAGMVMVVFSVNELGSAPAAMKEYNSQLDSSRTADRDKKGEQDEQKTVLEPGIGEGAFSGDMVNGSVLSMTAVHNTRVFSIAIVGAEPLAHDRVRGLLQTAVSH